MLNLMQETADSAVKALKLVDASRRHRDGLKKLPEPALKLEQPATCEIRAAAEPQWFLLLEHEEPEATALRPHLPLKGMETARVPVRALAAPL